VPMEPRIPSPSDAVRRNGTVKWARPATGPVNATPAILFDGRIAFVDEAGAVLNKLLPGHKTPFCFA
jgi:hypothetical protein